MSGKALSNINRITTLKTKTERKAFPKLVLKIK